MRYPGIFEVFVNILYFECRDCKKQKKVSRVERFIEHHKGNNYTKQKKCPFCGGTMEAVLSKDCSYIIS